MTDPTALVEQWLEKVARQIAAHLGDDFNFAFVNKQAWMAARGESGGRFRDVNEPTQSDYLDAARAAILTLAPEIEAARMDGARQMQDAVQREIETWVQIGDLRGSAKRMIGRIDPAALSKGTAHGQ